MRHDPETIRKRLLERVNDLMATTEQLLSDVQALNVAVTELLAKGGSGGIPAADQSNIDAADTDVTTLTANVNAALTPPA